LYPLGIGRLPSLMALTRRRAELAVGLVDGGAAFNCLDLAAGRPTDAHRGFGSLPRSLARDLPAWRLQCRHAGCSAALRRPSSLATASPSPVLYWRFVPRRIIGSACLPHRRDGAASQGR
jgi:hypothetical protein